MLMCVHLRQVPGSSSLPSPQSSEPSQIHREVIHFPLPHRNWLEVQVAASVGEQEGKRQGVGGGEAFGGVVVGCGGV